MFRRALFSTVSKRYTPSHEWLLQEGKTITVGIDNYAQDNLGEIVFVDLPEEGDFKEEGELVVAIESTKAVGEINMPSDGKIIKVNQNLLDQPEIINQDPEGSGWIFKYQPQD